MRGKATLDKHGRSKQYPLIVRTMDQPWRNLQLGCFLLACCVTSLASADDPVVLRLWNIPDTSSPGADARAERRIMDQFQHDHPNVELRKTAGISIPQIGGSAALLMSISGGVAPDVLECNQADLSSFIEQGFLLPLDDYLKEVSPEGMWERAPKQLWEAAKRMGPDGQPHIYALPARSYVASLKVRRDLAAKLGFPEAKLPQTWDELYAMAQAVTNSEQGRSGIGLPLGAGLTDFYHVLLVNAGGRAMEVREDGKLYAAFDSEEAVLALDFLWKLKRGPWSRDGKPYQGVAYSDVDMWSPFKRGRYVATISFMSDRGIMRLADPDRFRLAPLPRAPNGKAVPLLVTAFVGLYAGQNDERVRRATWDYLWFGESREGRKIRTETLVKEGAGQSANPLYLAQFGYTEELAKMPKGYVEFYSESLKAGYLPPSGQGAADVMRGLNNPVQRVMAEDLSKLTDEQRRAHLARVLKDGAAETNARLHNPLTPAQARMRTGTALVVAVAIFATFAFLFRVVHRAYAPQIVKGSPHRSSPPKGQDQDPGSVPPDTARSTQSTRTLKVSLILLPALALVALWEYYPLLRGTIIAFQDYRFLGDTRFVGLDNFVSVLFSPFWWAAMGRTVIFVALSLGLGFFTPIFLAILLHEIPRGKILFRILYYLPALTTGIVVIFLWKSFYEPDKSGYLNQLMGLFGLPPQRWLEDPNLAMLCCVLPTIWAGVGPGCLIYLAALKSIPEDLFEAASIDGCGFFNKVRLVAIPYMKPLIIMNFVGVFISTFQSSGYVLILTGGGPDNTTLVASLEIFYEAYARLDFGAATAMSWILAFSLIGFTLFQVKYLSKVEFRSASAR